MTNSYTIGHDLLTSVENYLKDSNIYNKSIVFHKIETLKHNTKGFHQNRVKAIELQFSEFTRLVELNYKSPVISGVISKAK